MVAAEGEDLLGEPRGALGGLADLLEVLVLRLSRPEIAEQKAGVALNGGEQMVEVMGDAAGEAPEHLHAAALRPAASPAAREARGPAP